MNITQETNKIELITSYFQQGSTDLKMLEFLKLYGIEISLSNLERKFIVLDFDDVYHYTKRLRRKQSNP